MLGEASASIVQEQATRRHFVGDHHVQVSVTIQVCERDVLRVVLDRGQVLRGRIDEVARPRRIVEPEKILPGTLLPSARAVGVADHDVGKSVAIHVADEGSPHAPSVCKSHRCLSSAMTKLKG